ncbi:hypothetical protein [Nonomuraea indica]|uniref:hypothetical protein n=1 Tax=Nonomuraea indica TaxID=1581193 RepID=UPI000C7BFC50|nr:hypothetical protein [Nonomuraea indica]
MSLALDQLDWVIEYWPDLLTARLPMATPRPWRHPQLSEQARAERDTLARAERFERTALSLGESPAPVDVAILQTALDILVRADDLADNLAQVTMCPPLRPPTLGELDARPWLHFAAARLAEAHDGLAEWAAPITAWMVDQTARAMSLVYDGQALDVVCPWCKGVTPETPAGGARTWSVVTLPGDQIAIVCSGVCEPPQREVGTWWRGQPCWPISDWERLAKHVRVSEAHIDGHATMTA